MPITALNCPVCHRVVPLDHFMVTDCGLQIHPDYVAVVLDDRTAQDKRSGVRVTNGTGCPRAAAILSTENVTVNPLDFNAAITGTAFHTLMLTGGQGNEIEVSGVIEGVKLTGHIDRVRRTSVGLAIEDWKHGNDFARKYAELKPEYCVQLSIYGELHAQTYGERPTVGIIWRHFTSSPPFAVFRFDLWPTERCLDHRPYGGDYTVRELLQQARNGGEWRDMPLAGSSMSFGSKSFCDYCEVRAICTEAAIGAPF